MAYNVIRDNNNQMLGCINCYVSGSSKNNALINCTNVSAIACSGIVAMNCSAILLDHTMNGFTFNLNSRVLRNDWGSINSSNGSALAPYSLGNSGTFGKYEIDTSLGDCYVMFNTTQLHGTQIELNVINATNKLILLTQDNVGTFQSSPLPYTIKPKKWESFTISVNGDNLNLI